MIQKLEMTVSNALVIYAILDDDNVTDFYESHYDNIVYLTRTTEGQEASYIHGELIEA